MSREETVGRGHNYLVGSEKPSSGNLDPNVARCNLALDLVLVLHNVV